MSTITQAQETNIYEITVGLFNAAPNAAYFAELNSLVSGELGGLSSLQLAQTLATTTAFTSGIMGGQLTPAAQTTQIMGNFGLVFSNTPTIGTASGDAQTWLLNQLNANRGWGEIVNDCINYLSDAAWVSANQEFASTANTLLHKVAVAKYYSLQPSTANNTLEDLQFVLASITNNTPIGSSLELSQAVFASKHPTGTSYALTTGIDSITGAKGGNNFNAVFSDGHAQTFNIGDAILGGKGVNTLNISSDPLFSASVTTLSDSLWSKVSNVQNLSISTDAGALNLRGDTSFQKAFSTNAMTLLANSGNGAITIDLGTTPFTGTASITAKSTAGTQNITTGTGQTTVTTTTNGGDQTITGAGLNVVNAITIGAGAQTITSTFIGNVNINATSAVGAQTITTGPGNDTIMAVSNIGAQTITTGAGTQDIHAISGAFSGNAITVGAGQGTIFLSGTGYTITVGSAGFGFATTPNYVISGMVGSDFLRFSNDSASANTAITSLGETSITAIEEAVVKLGAHGIAYGMIGGNTYVAENLANGAASPTNTSLVELTGFHTLTAIVGKIAIITPVVIPVNIYVSGPTEYVSGPTVYVNVPGPTVNVPGPTVNNYFYTLTSANESYNGGVTSNNTFNGTWTNGATNTFNVGDELIGGTGGGNVLNISSTSVGTMTLTGANFASTDANITTFKITNTGAGNIAFTGDTNFLTAFGSSTIALTALENAAGTIAIVMSSTTGNQTITATTADAVSTSTIAITTGSGAQTTTANSNAGAITITGTASNATNSFTAISTSGAVTVTAGGTGSNTIVATSTTGAVTVTAGITEAGKTDNITVNAVSGAGTINIQLGVASETYDLTLGAHTAYATINVSSIGTHASSSPNTVIRGAIHVGQGDTIHLTDTAAAGTNSAQFAGILSLAEDLATALLSTADHGIASFTNGGNTYIVETLSAHTFASTSTFIELTGLHTIDQSVAGVFHVMT